MYLNLKLYLHIDNNIFKQLWFLLWSAETFFNSAIFVDLFRHQLELPGVYSQLQAFYNDKKGVLPDSASSLVVSPASTPSTPSSLLPEMKVQNSPI